MEDRRIEPSSNPTQEITTTLDTEPPQDVLMVDTGIVPDPLQDTPILEVATGEEDTRMDPVESTVLRQERTPHWRRELQASTGPRVRDSSMLRTGLRERPARRNLE
jgi:hypothetical protein